jgi:osmotically-inducible protein OsmY
MTSTLRRAHRVLVLILVPMLASVAACGRNDTDVRNDVRAQLAVEPDTAPLDLTVTVTQGVVTLAGDTRTHAQQDRAIVVAKAVKGVTDVKSAMKLGDEGIAEAIRQAIAADPAVAQIPLEVTVKDGVASLSSAQTNRDERQKLVALARPVEGVKNVVDNMR